MEQLTLNKVQRMVAEEVTDKSFADTFADKIAPKIKQIKTRQHVEECLKRMLVLIKLNPLSSAASVSKELNISERTVATYFTYLRDAQLVEFKGMKNGGHWEIRDETR